MEHVSILQNKYGFDQKTGFAHLLPTIQHLYPFPLLNLSLTLASYPLLSL